MIWFDNQLFTTYKADTHNVKLVLKCFQFSINLEKKIIIKDAS